MSVPKPEEVRSGISMIWDNLQCPICLDILSVPVSTKCDHQFCKFCMMKLLDRTKRKEASCPVCKMKVTRRSLKENSGFQKLVEGLQQIIQSYEYDTGLNYHTGMPQRRQQAVEERCSVESACASVANGSAVGPDEHALSLSASTAAKEGFARMMGIEDSCPLTSDPEGFDSGLGELPLASSKEPECCISNPPTAEEEQQAKKSDSPVKAVSSSIRRTRSTNLVGQDGDVPKEACTKTQRRSGRRVALNADRIGDRCQKKSVEKVSEWLLKISPTDDTQRNDNIEDLKGDIPPNSDDSVSEEKSLSSSYTVSEHNVGNEKTELNPGRRESGKCLEEQIFGVVYKRGHRTPGTKGNRSLSSERVLETSTSNPTGVEEVQSQCKKTSRRRSHNLTPSDFIRRPHSEDKEHAVRDVESTNTEEQQKAATSDLVNETTEGNHDVELQDEEEQMITADVQRVEEEKEVRGEAMQDSPVFEVSVQRPGRSCKAKMQEEWHDKDKDLNEKKQINPENMTGRKRRNRRTSCENAKKEILPDQISHGKATTSKWLVLVSAESDSCSVVQGLKNIPTPVETVVQIESYPSSEEPLSPIVRTTRRSKKLQAFTEEVQGSKRTSKAGRKHRKIEDGSDTRQEISFNQANVNGEEANNSARQADVTIKKNNGGSLSNEKTEKPIRRNGCICESDLGGIKKIQSCGDIIECVQEINVSRENSALNENTQGLVEHNTPPSGAMTASPQNPTEPAGPCSPLVQICQESPSSILAKGQICTVPTEEGENDDSELDTEQLMKTFKTTKRKSFYLGSPKTMFSERSKSNSPDGEASKENVPDHTTGLGELDLPPISEEGSMPPAALQQDTTSNTRQANGDEVIPSSNASFLLKAPPHTGLENSDIAQGQGKLPCDFAGTASPECSLTRSSGICESSGLSPNRVSKCLDQSPGFPVHSEAVDSCQLFPALSASEDDPQSHSTITSRRQPAKLASHGEVLPESLSIPNSDSHDGVQDSSPTPDGLVPAVTTPPAETALIQETKEANGGGVEILSQPCVRLKRKRRAQKLDSSESESCSEEDDLPCMAQIFRCDMSGPLHSRPMASQSQESQVKEAESESVLIRLSQNGCPNQRMSCPGEGVNGTAVQLDETPDGRSPHPTCQDEWLPSSQGSVDLFGTPEECTGPCEGIAAETGLSMDSSQYSSEILNTQQKVDMQEELRHLERMMAIVSEALHQREAESQAQVHSLKGSYCAPPSTTPIGPSPHDPQSPEAGRGETATRHSGLEPGRESSRVAPRPGAPDCLGPVQPCGSLSRAQPEQGQHQNRLGQTLRSSSRLSNQTSRVKGHRPNVILEAPSGGVRDQRAKVAHEATNTTESRMELVASGLNANQLGMVGKFAKRMCGGVSGQMTPHTTHLIIGTDENLVCERTLKYFQGIAGRKWVVSFLWISECFREGKILDEGPFEVRGDVVNGVSHCGPGKARTTKDENLLMRGYEVCFQGSFTDMTTGQMELMVEMCGAKVVKDPLLFSSKQVGCQLVVVQPGSDDSQSYYRALQKKATVVTRGWLLDTIATYTLQNPEDYRT